MPKNLNLRERGAAAGLHLLLSLLVAGVAAVIVFLVWYPGAFRLMAGGRDLFLILIAVDVVIGPLLTFAVFNRSKGRRHLARDLAVIGFLQLAALAYGMHTVYIARPVALVFEIDRFRLVRANDVVEAELPKAPPGLQTLSLTGPRVIAARRPESGAERNDALFQGVAGVDVGQRPLFWQPYEQARDRARSRARPLSSLLARYAEQARAIREGLREMKADERSGLFLPVMARSPWVAVMDGSGVVLGYLPYEGFF